MITTHPHLFTLRGELLAQARERVLAGDSRLRPALAALREEAEAALAVAPPSVMDKQRVPPSGDKHDFVSLAPYWWPDPEKPDGVPYIRRDGEVNPESMQDSDRVRLMTMTAGVETLALAWYFTGHAPYAEKAAAFLRRWFLDPATCMHPHLQYGQGIPGHVEGRGIGIIDTTTLSRLVDIVALLPVSECWTDDDRQGVRAWMAAYLEWLLTSEHGKDEVLQRNNHGSWHDAQTAALALFVGQEDVARRVIETSKRVRIDIHIAADGSQPHELARTRSLDYSLFNLQALTRLAEMGRHVGIDLWHYVSPTGGSLRAAIDFLAPYADPAQQWPYRQIIDVALAEQLPLLLRMAALAYQDSRYEAQLAYLPAGELRRLRLQLLYPSPTEGVA